MANPDWVKGVSGNPAGRPVGSYAIHTKLEKAIAKVENTKGIDIYEHFVEQALGDKNVLIALLRKLVPDRQHSEGEIGRIINIVYGHRSRSDNEALRNGQRRDSIQAKTNATEGA